MQWVVNPGNQELNLNPLKGVKRMKIWSLVAMTGLLCLFAGPAYAVAPIGVPEIDAGSATSALSILFGVTALAAERLRRRR